MTSVSQLEQLLRRISGRLWILRVKARIFSPVQDQTLLESVNLDGSKGNLFNLHLETGCLGWVQT